MNHRDGEKQVEAGRETFPADDQSAVLALEPRKPPLGLKAQDGPFLGAPPRLSGLPHPFGDLGVDPTSAEALAKGFGVISFIRRQHREPFARAAAFAGADVEGIQQRDDLGSLVTIGWYRARGQRHTSGVREAVDEEVFPFRPYAIPSPPPLPWGKRAVDGPVLPLNHPVFFGNPEEPGLHGGESAVRLPALRGALGGPLESMGDITLAAAGDPDVEYGFDDLTKLGRRHATTPLRWLRRRKI